MPSPHVLSFASLWSCPEPPVQSSKGPPAWPSMSEQRGQFVNHSGPTWPAHPVSCSGRSSMSPGIGCAQRDPDSIGVTGSLSLKSLVSGFVPWGLIFFFKGIQLRHPIDVSQWCVFFPFLLRAVSSGRPSVHPASMVVTPGRARPQCPQETGDKNGAPRACCEGGMNGWEPHTCG